VVLVVVVAVVLFVIGGNAVVVFFEVVIGIFVVLGKIFLSFSTGIIWVVVKGRWILGTILQNIFPGRFLKT